MRDGVRLVSAARPYPNTAAPGEPPIYNGVCSSVCEDGLYCSRGEEGPHWLHGRDAFDENSEDWQHTFYDSLDPKVRP